MNVYFNVLSIHNYLFLQIANRINNVICICKTFLLLNLLPQVCCSKHTIDNLCIDVFIKDLPVINMIYLHICISFLKKQFEKD